MAVQSETRNFERAIYLAAPAPQNTNSPRAPHAALQNSEKQISELIKLTISSEKITKKLTWLTWVLIGIGVMQIAFAFYQDMKISVQIATSQAIYTGEIKAVGNAIKNTHLNQKQKGPEFKK
jgi:hypothetical protein